MKTKLLYLTASSEKEAVEISRIVTTERLAACANVLGKIKSIYYWDEQCQETTEFAVILKTSEKNTKLLIDRITEIHSYECPCIIVSDITDGHMNFLNWINTQTK